MQRGFAHVDLDSRSSRASLLRSGNEGLQDELATIVAENSKVVVTWTFTEETQLSYVETIQALGFEWIWTDCDQGAAFDALIAARPNLKLPRFIDPFEQDGSFRALETFTAEVRRRRPMARPRFRVPALPKPAWAGVVAFAAARASATGAYVAGAFNGVAPQPVRVAAAAIHHAHTGTFPVDGVLVPGKSLAGVSLGDTTAQVRKLWGKRFTICRGCFPTTWFYWSPTGGPFGAGLTLRQGRVTAVFTLGSPTGWHMAGGGPRVGQLLDHFNNPGNATQRTCRGYGATSTRTGKIVTSILTQGQAVYGFALTRPSESVCH